MGNGAEPDVIRPGSKIPNSDWTVESIDREKAVLVRGGNAEPHRIVVRLESPPPGMGGGGIGGPGAGGGGGFPGAPGPGGMGGGRFPGAGGFRGGGGGGAQGGD